MLLYAIVFLTFWMIILVVFHQYTYKYIDLLYLTFICLILGSYISFINPGKYIYKSGEKEEIIEFNGYHRIIIIDISMHFIFFFFVYFLYYNYYKRKDIKLILNSILLILIYLIITSIIFYIKYKETRERSLTLITKDVYGIKTIEILIIFTVATTLYFFI